MQKPIFDARFFTTAVILVLLLFFQFTFQAVFEGGGLCATSLLPEKSTESYQAYEWATYGWPLGYVTVSHEGCFSERKTEVQWNIPFLLVDALLMAVIAALPYGLSGFGRRSRGGASPAR